MHGIQHSKIVRSSYRKLAWVEFEPTTTDTLRRSNRLSYQYLQRLTEAGYDLCFK